ncbi:hypothetical protein ACFFWC_24375 [Plantactinospora siamensis]|uniref:Uncharacterized protein n=1 Tax=Plantactinospora siamensis TaxID=555372 RepID=A0ABV6P6K4_9ACTN
MSVPTLEPAQRDTVNLPPTDSYRPADRVWVHRGSAWCAGVVESCSTRAATVRYRPTTSRGTAVDTVTALYLARRAERDPVLDGR